MPQYNRAELGRMATESGFVRDTFEKVLRLKEILKFLNEDKSLREHLLLKGGTAINLTVFNIPRLSVDIDIDLNSSAGRMIAYYNRLSGSEILLPYTFNDEKSLKKVVSFNDGWIQMIQDNTVSILGWIKYEKVKWLQNNNPEVPGIVYKLTQEDEKARKLENVRKLWDAILEIRPVKNVFMEGDINRESYAVDHFIPRNFVMNDELWNLMPMDPIQNMQKNKKLPAWNDYFEQFANNQFIMYELIHEKPGLQKLYKHCYKDNLHSIWAVQELYRKGNSPSEFINILGKNMQPVYDSARRQGYEIWKVS